MNKNFGDAKISENIVIFCNSKNAKFDDMKNLIEFIRENVQKKTGIKLETEIEIIE